MECSSLSSGTDVGKRAGGEDELVQSSEKGSHEGVGLGDVDLSGVVHVELGPGAGEELGHVRLHLGFGHLLGHEENFSCGLLGTVSVENLLSSELSSHVLDGDGVVVENVVHNIVLVGAIVSGGRSIGSSGRRRIVLLELSLEGDGLGVLNADSKEGHDGDEAGVFHAYKFNSKKIN